VWGKYSVVLVLYTVTERTLFAEPTLARVIKDQHLFGMLLACRYVTATVWGSRCALLALLALGANWRSLVSSSSLGLMIKSRAVHSLFDVRRHRRKRPRDQRDFDRLD
jgi:hypothetical protein